MRKRAAGRQLGLVSGKGPGSLGEMRVVGFAMAGWDARVAEESSRGNERRWWVRRLAVCYVKLNTPIPEQSQGVPSQRVRASSRRPRGGAAKPRELFTWGASVR